MAESESTSQTPSDDLRKKIAGDSQVRQELTRADFSYFWNVYCMIGKKRLYRPAPFQLEIMAVLQDPSFKFFVLEGFRGCSKSSIANTAFSIWSVVGAHQIKFILIIAGSIDLARTYMNNIKALMESEPLRSDLGPFRITDAGEWRANAIDIPKYGARIVVVSAEQNVRGILHNNLRPQIVIMDDLENAGSAQSEDMKKRLWDTVRSDILPVGDLDTRFLVIGTRIAEDSLIMRFKSDIESGKRDGIFCSYPIVDDDGAPLWPDKFPTKEDVERYKAQITGGDEVAWLREFMLQVVTDEAPAFRREWTRYYDALPEFSSYTGYRFTATGIDLAIRKGFRNDYTAMVTASVYEYGKDLRIYIHPFPVNERLDFPETVARAKQVSESVEKGVRSKLVVESVGYQAALVQQLDREGYPAVEYQVHGNDKGERLALTTPWIRNGTVLWPHKGAEEILKQAEFFGRMKHDDLLDAFTTLILKIMEDETKAGRIVFPSEPLLPRQRGRKTKRKPTASLSPSRK